MKNLPPPHDDFQTPTDLPDYYLGCLLWFDDLSDDNCRWVVYDGANRVRCPSRRDAVNYICMRRQQPSDDYTRKLVSARLHINHAFSDLRDAAAAADPMTAAIMERLSVKLRPLLVELDNQILR